MAAQHFDEARAARSDRKIRLLTPGYEALHSMTNHLLRSLLPAEARLLVVGAGTGMEIIFLAENRHSAVCLRTPPTPGPALH